MTTEEVQNAVQEHLINATRDDLIRAILEALCTRDGLSLESYVEPGEPARNYELALRLNIGYVFGLVVSGK